MLDAPRRVKQPLKNRACKTRRHKRRGTLVSTAGPSTAPQDEYFRYVSLKWIAGYSTLILSAGLWAFCAGPQGMSFLAYFAQVFIFVFIFSFMLLWFDLQYDMSTIF